MKKTAMQLLIEWIDGKAITHESVRLKATELLETEREQIEGAYLMGRQDQTYDMMHEYYNRSKQQYYKDTYE